MTTMVQPTRQESPALEPMPARAPLRLLGIGADPEQFRNLARWADAEQATLELARDPSAVLRQLGDGSACDLLLAMLGEDPEEELGWWSRVLDQVARPPRFVVLANAPSMSLVVRAAELRVFEVLSLPVTQERLRELLRRIRAADRETVLALPPVRPVCIGLHRMVSESPAMLGVFRSIAQVAPSTATVLITGESGTGKELIAQAIHAHGPRASGRFVAVNCAAIPENLLESELFGHEKGAFTGAVARKIGRFERASGGTLFLDEIGDMSLPLQSKILRAVQEREIDRVGGTDPIPVDVRVIAATNCDLRAMIAQGRFREDLYYRLAVVTVNVPPLAERGDDLLLLTAAFLDEFGRRYGKKFGGVTDRALALLRQHEWVGNVRELRNVIERATLLAEGDVLRAEHLPEEWQPAAEGAGEPTTGEPATLQDVEARHIARVLAQTHGQISEAARILGVHRNTLSRKIREYAL